MKRRALIVGENIAVEVLAAILEKEDFAVAKASHEEALAKFFSEEPNLVIVFGSDTKEGKQTLSDLNNSSAGEKIIGLGFDKSDSDNYVQLPCRIDDLAKKLE